MSKYETIERGVATSDGYCYAYPFPIRTGDPWRRERVGNEVPHVFRLVHDACPYRVPSTSEGEGA